MYNPLKIYATDFLSHQARKLNQMYLTLSKTVYILHDPPNIPV